jgi:L-ascorbate metabolism protein UlaG (beta-lactamase superfamily)
MIELDWWNEVNLEGLSFVATPAKHFSGKLGLVSTMKTLGASWVIKSSENKVYYSGESGYGTHYQTIGDKLGTFDIVFMDSGQYNEHWLALHNMPEEVIKGFGDLGGRYLVPVHWDMFNMSLHNWFDQVEEATTRSKQNKI